MAEEQQNPYVAVLADLERQRDDINATIATIKRMMGLSADEPISSNGNPASAEPTEIRSDTFFGMSISEAIRKYLGMVKRPKRASEITKALEQGGYPHTSKNFLATVQTTLTRMKGAVVRVPNGWGLIDWYPGRNFEKAATKTVEAKRPARRRPNKLKRHAIESEKAPKPSSSRQLQAEYMTLMKKIPKDKRNAYKNVALQEGRESAIKAMRRAIIDQDFH